MAAPWRIDLFGGLRLSQEQQSITRFRTQKTASLLGYLAVRCPRPETRNHLAALFWPYLEDEAARHNLRMAISSLRRQLEGPGAPAGSVVVCDRVNVALNPAAVVVDVALFRDAVRSAMQAQSTSERVRHWGDAVELYRGELLPDCWEDWAIGEREHLSTLFMQAVQHLVKHCEASGDTAGALEYAQRALQADPLSDEAHRDVIRLYAAAGQAQAALNHYDEWARLARQELDAPPAPETRALVEKIRQAGSGARPAGRRSPGAPSPKRVPVDLLGLPRPWEGHVGGTSDTVTFLLMDGAPVQADAARALFRRMVERHRGIGMSGAGGADAAAFGSVSDATACAVAIQAAGAEEGAAPLRAALHTGDVTAPAAAGAPWGNAQQVLQAARRLLSSAHPGQILCSEGTAALLLRPSGGAVSLVDLGMHRLASQGAPEHIFQVQYPGMPAEGFPPLSAEVGGGCTLPAQVTRFFGREEEIERLCAILASPDTRLVTLTGLGGSGKTRLAIEVATRLLEYFQGAEYFVPLAELTDARSLPDAIVDALRLPRSPGLDPIEQVVATLSVRRTLLLLDSMEQIVEDAGPVLSRLLSRLPHLTCLVTSRRALDIQGEYQFPVHPLPVSEGEETPEAVAACASVRLFVDRARAVRPDFQVNSGNAASLAALCSHLEGVPLALELVAARVRVMSVTQMLERINQRLDWQASRTRGVTERHRSLRAAIDWSYRLLPPQLRAFLEQLSVFRGGWSPAAAQAVCAAGARRSEAETLEDLRQLEAHSLVIAEECAGEMRFRMLETLRDYAREQLEAHGDAQAVFQRHAEFFLALAEDADSNLQGWAKQVILDRLETEHDNLRAALSWAAEAAPLLEARLAGAMAQFWEIRGHSSEGRRRLEAVLARGADLPEALRIKLLHGTARLAWYQGDLGRAGAVLQEVLAHCRRAGSPHATATALIAVGDVAHRQVRLEDANACYRESAEIFRGLGDTAGLALALYRLGMSTSDTGDHAAALPILEESLKPARQDGDRATIAAIQAMIGQALFRLGRLDEARAILEEALATARQIGDLWALVFAQWSLGNMALVQGDLVTAVSLFGEGMPKIVALANKWAVAYGLESYGYLCAALGLVEPAVRIFASADALREAIGSPLPPSNLPDFERVLGSLRAALGAARFERCWSEGRATPWEQAAAYALEVTH